MTKVNRARLKARRKKDTAAQAELCWDLPCVACGIEPTDEIQTQAHHILSKGSGGTDMHCVPLCHLHHREGHTIGWKTWQAKWGIDLKEVAAGLADQIKERS